MNMADADVKPEILRDRSTELQYLPAPQLITRRRYGISVRRLAR